MASGARPENLGRQGQSDDTKAELKQRVCGLSEAAALRRRPGYAD